MLDQLKHFSIDPERSIDIVAIADSIPKVKSNATHNHFTSTKNLIKLWDSLKKKLKDPNKRENEF
jgi:hypothetical protein